MVNMLAVVHLFISDYAEIKSMFVDPNYRGKRIGDALLVHMLGTMADNSVPRDWKRNSTEKCPEFVS